MQKPDKPLIRWWLRRRRWAKADKKKSGYKNPPIELQFKKGQSGNPKGRPKGRKSISGIFNKIANKRITLNTNGKEAKVSYIEAVIFRQFEKAIKGDGRSAEWVTKTWQNQPAIDDQDENLSSSDEALLADFEKRLKRKTIKGGEEDE